MTARLLTLINTVGCLILATVVVLQWMHEREMKRELEQRGDQLMRVVGERDAQLAKREALEADVAMLKDSLGAAKLALEARDVQLAARAVDIEVLNRRIIEAKAQLDQWEVAVRQRDRRITELEAALQAARERLDQAVLQLNKVADRPQ